MTSHDHFNRLSRLLDVESKYEQWQALELVKSLSPSQREERGVGLTDLQIRDTSPGFGGFILTFGKRDDRRLPWLRLSDGSPVLLQAPALRRGVRGVMAGRDPFS